MQAHGVLAHFQTATGDAAGVGGLARCVEDAGFDEQVHRFQRGRHVGAFGHADAAVLQQGAGIFAVQLVLRCAGQGDVARQAPGTLVGQVGHAEVGAHFFQTTATDVLQVHQVRPLLFGQAVREMQGAGRVGQGDDPAAHFHDLLRGVLRHVAGTGNGDALAFEAAAHALEHFLGEVDTAIAGGFGADQAAAVGQALAGEHRGELVGQALVLAEEEADFPAAYTDVTGRYVEVGADVAIQLGHERLAEAHHFVVALALGVEVRAALAAAHGQRGQGILEDLFEREELKHPDIDRRMKAQAALVRADGAVHLDAVATVDAHLALVVDPGYAEHDGALGLDHALKNAGLQVVWVGFEEGPEAADDLFYGLVELGLVGVALLNTGKKGVNGFNHLKSPRRTASGSREKMWPATLAKKFCIAKVRRPVAGVVFPAKEGLAGHVSDVGSGARMSDGAVFREIR